MIYQHIKNGTFISRPNRFIAHVKLEGQTVVCHVKNTGRCRELLIPGVKVILEYHPDAAAAGRKTEYDLIGVYKGGILINMDSQAPNRAAWEWLDAQESIPGLPGWAPDSLQREVTHGDSRFDLAFTLNEINGSGTRPAFMEVKGVTLETDGMAMFPDAPTERGIKHLHGLAKAVQEGYEAYVLFVIQMKGIQGFTPNDITHPAFGETLRQAREAGVHVLAYDCLVTPDTMTVDSPVKVMLD